MATANLPTPPAVPITIKQPKSEIKRLKTKI
jgi:hypothetical protein